MESEQKWKSLNALITVNEEIINRIDKSLELNSSHSFFIYSLHQLNSHYHLKESLTQRTSQEIISTFKVTVPLQEIPELFIETPKNVITNYEDLKSYLQATKKLLQRAQGFMGDIVKQMPIIPLLLKNMELIQVHLGDLEGKFLVQESQKELYQKKVDQLNSLLQDLLSSPSMTKPKALKGYSPTATHYFQIGEYMWLCVGKGSSWEEIWRVCNEEDGFHLASVNAIKLLGLPDKDQWGAASRFLKEKGFNYVVTGQPVRGSTWDNVQQLGFISTGEDLSGPNWREMYSGNGEAGREWPNASPPSYGNLVSLVINVSHFPGTCVKNHIWRYN